MKRNWYIVNERLLVMERVPVEARGKEWVEEWNSLIDFCKSNPGCLKRDKYEEVQPTKARTKEKGNRDNVQGVHGHLAQEEALLGSVGEMVGEGSTVSVLSPHTSEEQI